MRCCTNMRKNTHIERQIDRSLSVVHDLIIKRIIRCMKTWIMFELKI